ncbi:hypothetical protein SLH46_12095 [Draconibacterium sp. IB214405]|uniref:hypothetical protein n=1 Tax=Draconibacterium sp. IB214405 TaxID=3097352 RepID=UPI002A14A24B|nr:hypothetical protein [Draconibacterium sp. IB214405]MDX8339931.1 hypothetical protein [Draconibacterium sp. IB214405]
MSEVNKHITIPKEVNSGNDLDYQFLREKGQEYIEKLASSIWTDYNSHDPGITILEMLCYAITDLGARISLPIEDLLVPLDSSKSTEDQFFDALQILPSKPVTENDYRKLFIDIKGVKNCWLQKFEKTVYVDCKNDLLSYDPDDFNAIDDDLRRNFQLNGLYKLTVDFDELDDKEFPHKADKDAEIERITNLIISCYHENRNLCEDLIKVSEVETHGIQVCASIEVEPEADEELVHAKVLRAIDNYFSPDLWFYSLQHMLDKGYTPDQIFDGPTLTNGFIDPEELENARLRTEVRLSDLMQLIMKIDGVKVIKDISINDCDDTENENDAWLICVHPGMKPKRCESSAFSYYKDVLPLNVNSKKVKEYIQKLEVEEQEKQALAKVGMELKVPKGSFKNIGETTTIQNDFPETYGIGTVGLSSRATEERKAQAKQLKGYLLFFDQIFATYFAHLDKVKDLLTVDNTLAKTYFTQAVQDLDGFADLVNNYPLADDETLTKNLLAELDDNITRKNQLLDHLIARFAEKFSRYSFLMKEIYGSYADQAIINAKEKFLSEYGEIKNTDGSIKNKGISNWRGSAFNYFQRPPEEIWDTENVAGAQKRIARLSGIKEFKRRNLSPSYIETYKLTNSDGEEVFRWHIKNNDGVYFLSATEEYYTRGAAEDELYQTIVKIVETRPEIVEEIFAQGVEDEKEVGNFEIQVSPTGKYSFDVINTNADPNSTDRIIARQFLYYDTAEEVKAAILEMIEFFTTDFIEEGMFIVEHILLRPDVTSANGLQAQFIPVCTNQCTSCEPVDPYSYRVTVVLPGWTHRFRNMDFRKFMEELIRKELPAHVLARICWIGERAQLVPDGENEMILFEEAYHEFLLAKTDSGQEQDEPKLKKLIEILAELNTIYPTGRLIDCDDEADLLGGKIVLGRTNIGNL